MAGGIVRDLLIGRPPETFRDWRYLAVAAAAGLVTFLGSPSLERSQRQVDVLDAGGLALFCVAGAAVVVIASEAGSQSAVFPLLGMAVCFLVRLVGLHRDVNLPREPPESVARA